MRLSVMGHDRARRLSSDGTARRARLCYALPINKEAPMRGAPGGIIGLIILVVIIIVVLRLLGVV